MKKIILILAILLISILSYSQIIEELATWEYGPTEAIAVKDSTAYISSGSYLWVLDISDESNPTLVDEIKLENYIHYIRRIGNYLYVSKNDTILNIYDIKTADNPTLVNQMHGEDPVFPWQDLYVDGDTVYICGYYNQQYFLNDTINLQSIRRAGFTDQAYKLGTVLIGHWGEDRYVVVYNLAIAGDIAGSSDNYTPTETTRGLSANNNYAYFGYGSSGIGVLNIANPYDIVLKDIISTTGYTYDIELIEDTIMIAARGLNGIGIYDVDNDTIFTLIGECDTDGYAYELEVIGDRLYVGARSGGLIIIDISIKNNPMVLGEYQGYGECRKIDIEGDRLYVASGDGGLMIMDISTRINPIVISQCYSRHIAEDVVKQGNYVYMADGDSGLTIFDITNENNPSIVVGINTNHFAYYVEENITYNYLLVCGKEGTSSDSVENGITIYDISTPSNPIESYYLMKKHPYSRKPLIEDTIIYTLYNEGNLNWYMSIKSYTLADIYNPILIDSFSHYQCTGSGLCKIDNNLYYNENKNGTDSIIVLDGTLNQIDVFNGIKETRNAINWGGKLMQCTPDTLTVWNVSTQNVEDNLLLRQIAFEVESDEVDEYAYLTHDKYGLSIFGEQTGIEEKQIYTKQENVSITTTFKSISINNQTGIPQKYQLMDITGRIVNTIEAKSGTTVITPERSGVYFLMNKDNMVRKKFIIIR